MVSIVTKIGVFCVFYVIGLEKITKDNNKVEWQKTHGRLPYGARQPSAWNVRLRENPGRGLAIHIHDGLVEFLLAAGLGRFALGLGVSHYVFERKFAFFELLALAGIEAGITVGHHLLDR